MGTHLGIFAKFWAPGRVKTRLAASIGTRAAAELHRAFLIRLMSRFRDVGESREVVYAPDEKRDEFCGLLDESKFWSLHPQGEGDLGQRMQRFFERNVVRGRRVLLIGSDSPTLPADYLAQASRALIEHDVVLGPSDDGGYYLLGMRGAVPPVFTNIAWSSANVFRDTLHRLQGCGARCAVLPRWYDVDCETDLRRLLREIADPFCQTRRFYADVKGILKQYGEGYEADVFSGEPGRQEGL